MRTSAIHEIHIFPTTLGNGFFSTSRETMDFMDFRIITKFQRGKVLWELKAPMPQNNFSIVFAFKNKDRFIQGALAMIEDCLTTNTGGVQCHVTQA